MNFRFTRMKFKSGNLIALPCAPLLRPYRSLVFLYSHEFFLALCPRASLRNMILFYAALEPYLSSASKVLALFNLNYLPCGCSEIISCYSRTQLPLGKHASHLVQAKMQDKERKKRWSGTHKSLFFSDIAYASPRKEYQCQILLTRGKIKMQEPCLLPMGGLPTRNVT